MSVRAEKYIRAVSFSALGSHRFWNSASLALEIKILIVRARARGNWTRRWAFSPPAAAAAAAIFVAPRGRAATAGTKGN